MARLKTLEEVAEQGVTVEIVGSYPMPDPIIENGRYIGFTDQVPLNTTLTLMEVVMIQTMLQGKALQLAEDEANLLKAPVVRSSARVRLAAVNRVLGIIEQSLETWETGV